MRKSLRPTGRASSTVLAAAAAALALTRSAAPARAGDDAGEGGGAPSAGGKPTAVLLLVVTTPGGTVATFGQSGGDGGAAGAALAHAIEALGFRMRSAAGQTIAVSGAETDPLLPVGDRAALDVARRLGASVAWVAGVDIRDDGQVRGTRLAGAAGRAKLRVIDASAGNSVASGEAQGAGWGAQLDQAAAGAARDAAERLARAVEHDVNARWPAATATGGPAVAVRLRGARSWLPIAAIIQKLGATEGVKAVHARDVRRGRISLSVDTAIGAPRVAAAIEHARLSSGVVRAQPRGGAEVDVEIRDDVVPATGAPSGATPSDQD